MSFLHLLSQLRTPVLDSLMLGISHLGSAFAVMGIMVVIYLNIRKNEGMGMLLAFVYSGILTQCAKLVFRIPRPWNLDTAFTPVSAAVSSAGGYSFPSIHSQCAAVLFTALFLLCKNIRVRILSCLLLGMILFSRMYLGCHTPFDVITGALIGTVITVLVFAFWRSDAVSGKNDSIYVLFLFVFACVGLFLPGALMWNGTVDFEGAKNCFETAGIALGLSAAFILERRVLLFSPDGSRLEKLFRLLIAVFGSLGIIFGLKALGPSSVPLCVLRYAAAGFWMAGVSPALMIKLGILRKEKK